MRYQLIASTALLVLFLAGCSSKETEKEAEPVRPVQLGDAKRDSIERLIVVDGILRALNQSPVVPKISAPVARFLINRGDHVKEGDRKSVV